MQAHPLRQRGFNPTLVRLRQEVNRFASGVGKMFQSHAGSIEASGGGDGREWAATFQSHAGSIEAGP